jgi:hypothetical protein
MAFGWIGSTMPFGEVSARLLWDAISARIKTYVNPNRKYFEINRAFALKNNVGKTTGRMEMETVRRLRDGVVVSAECPHIVLTEAGSCSPRQSIGSTWPMPRSLSTSKIAPPA